jgi:superfamily II DNA or RNA helicase
MAKTREHKLKLYSSLDQPISQTLVPLLQNAQLYQRIAGYFASSVLDVLQLPLPHTIQVVANCDIDVTDWLVAKHIDNQNNQALELNQGLYKNIRRHTLDFQKLAPHYARLAELLATRQLEIRIVPKHQLFLHGKAGIVLKDNEKTVFWGSHNETHSGYQSNYEILSLDTDPLAIQFMEQEFHRLWDMGVPLARIVLDEITRQSARRALSYDQEPWDPAKNPGSPFVEMPLYNQGFQFKPWQIDFINAFNQHIVLYKQARLLLADEVGLGKTLAVAGAVLSHYLSNVSHPKPVLFIVPPSLSLQWQTELWEKLALPCCIWDNTKKKWVLPDGIAEYAPASRYSKNMPSKSSKVFSIESAPSYFMLVSQGLLSSDTEVKKYLESLPHKSFHSIVVDEAHKARNNNNLWDSLCLLGHKTDNYILATATPVQTSMADLWSLLDILNEGSALEQGTTKFPKIGPQKLLSGVFGHKDASKFVKEYRQNFVTDFVAFVGATSRYHAIGEKTQNKGINPFDVQAEQRASIENVLWQLRMPWVNKQTTIQCLDAWCKKHDYANVPEVPSWQDIKSAEMSLGQSLEFGLVKSTKAFAEHLVQELEKQSNPQNMPIKSLPEAACLEHQQVWWRDSPLARHIIWRTKDSVNQYYATPDMPVPLPEIAVQLFPLDLRHDLRHDFSAESGGAGADTLPGLEPTETFVSVYALIEPLLNTLVGQNKILGMLLQQRLCSSLYAFQQTMLNCIDTHAGSNADKDDDKDNEEYWQESEALFDGSDETTDEHSLKPKDRIQLHEFYTLHKADMDWCLAQSDAQELKYQTLWQYLVKGCCSCDADGISSTEPWRQRGCLIFSQYYDTASMVAEKLCTDLYKLDTQDSNEPQKQNTQQSSKTVTIALYASKIRSGVWVWDVTQQNAVFQTIPRDELKQNIQNNQYQIVVATEAACEGLNLQRLGSLVNMDLPWNPAKLIQRVGRIYRMGQQQHTIYVANLLYKNTIDSKIYSRIAQRLSTVWSFAGQDTRVISKRAVVAEQTVLAQVESSLKTQVLGEAIPPMLASGRSNGPLQPKRAVVEDGTTSHGPLQPKRAVVAEQTVLGEAIEKEIKEFLSEENAIKIDALEFYKIFHEFEQEKQSIRQEIATQPLSIQKQKAWHLENIVWEPQNWVPLVLKD